MKIVLSILLLFCIQLHAQEEAIEQFYGQLEDTNLSKEKKFQLLDTLAILTENVNFHPKYEEVATQCIQLGLNLKK